MAVIEDLLVKLGFKVNPEGLEGANKYLEGINHKLELLAGIEIAKGLVELVEHFSHFGDSLEQAAFQAGITAEQFQKLVYAGSQFNVTQDQMQNALAKMSRLLQSARDGSKGAIEQFARLGIGKDQIAGFNNAQEAFYGVQDALASIPDSFKRVAATQAVFGRGAVALTKFAASGSSASKRLGAEAEKMGAIVSNKGVEELAQFEDTMQGLSLTIRAFAGNVAATFAPAFRMAAKDIQGMLGASNSLIKADVSVWAQRVAFGIGFTVGAFEIVTEAIRTFIAEHPKLIAFATKTAAILISMSLANSILKTTFGGLKTAISLVSAAVGLLGGRLTLTIAAIAVAVLGIKALWDVMHGKNFQDTTFYKSLGALKNYALDGIGGISELFGGGKDADMPQIVDGSLNATRNIPTRTLAHMTKEQRQLALAPGLVLPKSMPDMGNPTALLQGPMMDAVRGMQILAESQVRSRPDRAQDISSWTTRMTQGSVNVDAPITVNIAGNADPKHIRHHMKKVVDEVFSEAASRLQRDHAPAAMR